LKYRSTRAYCDSSHQLARLVELAYSRAVLRSDVVVTPNNRKKLQFITLLTAICIVSHIENSKNDKGYIT